jgi:hypothetical protein
MSSFVEELHRVKAEAVERDSDPLRRMVEALVRGMQAISTHSLLDLLGLPNTTGNGRRIAHTMRSLGFVPIKSRRLMPGGWADTTVRGWARPFRALECRSNLKQGEKGGSPDLIDVGMN